MENEDLERIHTLETAQATQTATVAGMQTAQAVAHSGTWAVMGAVESAWSSASSWGWPSPSTSPSPPLRLGVPWSTLGHP
jgi:hypothetical protein